MGRKKADQESYRINITVTEEMISTIDELISELGYYNGRSDFVLAALRFFLDRMYDHAMSVISSIRFSNRALSEYYKEMGDFGDKIQDKVTNSLSAPLVKQIPIRLESGFYDNVCHMSSCIGTSIQSFCRIAMYYYAQNAADKRGSIEKYREKFDSFEENAGFTIDVLGMKKGSDGFDDFLLRRS